MPVRRPTSLSPVSPLSLRSSGPISSCSLCRSITSPLVPLQQPPDAAVFLPDSCRIIVAVLQTLVNQMVRKDCKHIVCLGATLLHSS